MVCTGNACRSPMAAAILQERLAERGVDARVTSAGTMPWSSGATAPAVEVMREHGLDISGHENRQVTRELVEEADLDDRLTEIAALLAGVPTLARRRRLGRPPEHSRSSRRR